jgi:hypothetical protein
MQLGTPRGSFREGGRMSTQVSEQEMSPTSRARKFNKSGAQGEHSGLFDQEGHHLKSDGTPDMRFKENREEFEGQGFEYSNKGGAQQTTEIEPKIEKRSKSLRPKSRGKSTRTEHKKSDGTPDMRFKENRETFAGKGYEGTTSRSSNLSKANFGLYEGNTPGEHSGKYDTKGHHLKNDGTPDMRFKENREEFEGQGYENTQARYKRDEDDSFNKKIVYRRKRPPTPYALYIRENASLYKKNNPDMDMNEVFRELAEYWRGLSEDEKGEYYDMYEEETKRFQEMNKTPHKGGLYFKKLAERRGINFNSDFGSSKRSRNKLNYREEEEDFQEETEEDEENYNPNEGITA